ncbi:MAG: hypothetical protein M1118_04080 [Chloroflexi bacterium]|nr:hypothetical protein [Chloroflexota bacterium]
MGRFSDVLYARPSFLGGMASVLDLGGTLVSYNDSATAEEADRRALYADWCQIGEDLRQAIAEETRQSYRPVTKTRRGRP